MSKARTIEAIESSAVEIFCRDGFDRASLRDIAQAAGVPLSSIHSYFESKADLYLQVGRRLNDALLADQRALLAKATAGGKALELETVIHCIIAPLLLPGMRRASAESRARPLLRTWFETSPYLDSYPQFRDTLRKSIQDWIGLIMQACPGLDESDGRMAYCLISSALYSWEANNFYFNRALELPGRGDQESECLRLVTFLAGGIRALAQRQDGQPSILSGCP